MKSISILILLQNHHFLRAIKIITVTKLSLEVKVFLIRKHRDRLAKKQKWPTNYLIKNTST